MNKVRGSVKIINRRKRKEKIMRNIIKTTVSNLVFVFMILTMFAINTNASTSNETEYVNVTNEVIENFNMRRTVENDSVRVKDREIEFVSTHMAEINGGVANLFEGLDYSDLESVEKRINKEMSTDISDYINVPRKDERIYDITEEEYNILCRVVEAEVTGDEVWYSKGLSYEDVVIAKASVARVYINRVLDNKNFSDITTLKKSLTQKNASSTFNDGRYYKVTVTDVTRDAVYRALHKNTPDYTNGALFFSAGTGCAKYGTHTRTDKVGHSFYNPYI